MIIFFKTSQLIGITSKPTKALINVDLPELELPRKRFLRNIHKISLHIF